MAPLEAIYNHVVLPPQLLGVEGGDGEDIGDQLLCRLMNAADSLRNITGRDYDNGWEAFLSSLKANQELSRHGLNKFDLQATLSSLPDTEKRLLICHIVEQNAALLIHRDTDAGNNSIVVFEAFEASPPSQEVLAAPNALRWTFPSRAACIPSEDYDNRNFQVALAGFLEKANAEQLSFLAATVTKSGASVNESRNATSPALITNMLLSLLEALGGPADVIEIPKRVRDDVHHNNGDTPWRRHPFWLVLRVSAYRQLQLLFGKVVGLVLYKLLVSMLLTHLLQDCVENSMDPVLVDLLQKKLCRRLSKLDGFISRQPLFGDHDGARLSALVDKTATRFQKSVHAAASYVVASFDRFKLASRRLVPRLPRRVMQRDLVLTLPSSSLYLTNLVNIWKARQNRANPNGNNLRRMLDTLSLEDEAGIQKVQKFSRQCLTTYEQLAEAQEKASTAWYPGLDTSSKEAVINVVSDLTTAITTTMAVNTMSASPERNSLILLTIFELWAQIDTHVGQEYPLFLEYSPLFSPELLNMLHLPELGDMKRLRRVQIYLQSRKAKSSFFNRTIFSSLDADCFGTRFARSSVEHIKLYSKINKREEKNRKQKTREWEKSCGEYDALSREISSLPCLCTMDCNGKRNVRGCTRCYKWRLRKNMKIDVCEDLLPENTNLGMAIIFELDVPLLIEKYRNITWLIATTFAYPYRSEASKGRTLKDHKPLCPYAKTNGTNHGITVAALIKSFNQTHYRSQRMKVALESVLLPLASDFRLYDPISELWISNLEHAFTLAHFCAVHIPTVLKDTLDLTHPHPPATPKGPSSYEVVASRPKCPPNMSVHEFEAYQRLLSGQRRRWVDMLVEMASCNLNFGKLDTMLMFIHLSSQAGPFTSKASDDKASENSYNLNYMPDAVALGDTHAVFMDSCFVVRLLEEAENRLTSICRNWRETNMMELVITLLLRVEGLAQQKSMRTKARNLLQLARTTTLGWISSLRSEVIDASEGEAAHRASMYAFRAALLCRRTFAVLHRHKAIELGPSQLQEYIRAAIALQQNLIVDLDKLEPLEHEQLRRDTIMAHELKSRICIAIVAYPAALDAVVADCVGLWSGRKLEKNEETAEMQAVSGQDPKMVFSEWHFLTDKEDGWITARTIPMDAGAAQSQRVDFHLIEGHILIDGKTVGKLPQTIRDSDDVRELFGNQHVLTFPSAYEGMTHRLVALQGREQVHFGVRNGQVVIMTVSQDSSRARREYVPRRIFIDRNGIYDLPRDLVDNCVHWFNTSTRTVEVRRRATLWKTKISDWKLDTVRKQAINHRHTLVDPHSPICRTIVNIFSDFEDLQRITVTQPFITRQSLQVALRNLELTFLVTAGGFLYCFELGAEIDPNQDAGTFYGYRSMIVLRDTKDHNHRSIIARIGRLTWIRSGPHIQVKTLIDEAVMHATKRTNGPRDERAYARFGIDNVLRRLTSPVEPRLLYTKAQLHAITSCPVPDALTGRTGQEEALHTLLSGQSQPWYTLSAASREILEQILLLAPKREFYPRDKRVLQTVTWDKHLPTNMQHDRYGRIVRELFAKSRKLEFFMATVQKPGSEKEEQLQMILLEEEAKITSNPLQRRGELQRARYEIPLADIGGIAASVVDEDRVYTSLGKVGLPSPSSASPVFHITTMLRTKPQRINFNSQVHMGLKNWPLMCGFSLPGEIDLMPISTLANTSSLPELWAGVVELCRTADQELVYSIMFTLSLMAFAPGANIDTIIFPAACFYIQGLREMQPPDCPQFTAFKYGEKLSTDGLEALISAAYAEFKPAARRINTWSLANREYEAELEKHRALCRREGLRFAEIIQEFWPGPSGDIPTYDDIDFASDVVDVELALERVFPEYERLWRNMQLTDYLSRAGVILQKFKVKTGDRSGAIHKPTNISTVCSTDTFVPAPSSAVPSLRKDLVKRVIHSVPKCPTNISLGASGAQSRPPVAGWQHHARPGTSGGVGLPYTAPGEFGELRRIVETFSQSSDRLRQKYGADLLGSLGALEQADQRLRSEMSKVMGKVPRILEVRSFLMKCSTAVTSIYQNLRFYFSELMDPSSRPQSINWLEKAGLWPRLTPTSLLELLRTSADYQYGQQVRETLIVYGLSITLLQRLRRVERALQKGDEARVAEEWRNCGHKNWEPAEQPDWLLLEIDCDLLIRSEQVDVARAIIAPGSQSNSVLQLNMGKGKTSCIVPMSIAILANGKQLARLIVPKALLLPTAQTVQSRLGGLVGRELRHVPFSRRIATGENAGRRLDYYKAHHDELQRFRGVLLAAPEHVLAFKLSGLQCLADGRIDLARNMVRFQTQLTDYMCRDVLDESDFTLAVRTQLVYPSGQLMAVDGAPHRWKLAQDLLSLVEDNLPKLAEDHPHSIQVLERQGAGFPLIYILNSDIESRIYQCIVDDISDGKIAFFRPTPSNNSSKKKLRPVLPPEKVKKMMQQALSYDASQEDIDKTSELFADVRSAVDGLVLVRGLLTNGILTTCLKKRWNVQYGLHPGRDPIAVPFEAKGVPSERSEFGHPDVAIFFTCLAFYYAGLDRMQLRNGLRYILQHSDDPATEYERWTAGSGSAALPADLQHWNMINVDDEGQLEMLWKHLHLTRPVINHYLNTFVFPVHARQFSVKLQASAWDLPLFTPQGKEALASRMAAANGGGVSAMLGARTTGFSGTNDNKMMLPLSIQQEDLPSLKQTNAEVLTYLLQQRNRQYVCTKKYAKARWTEEDLLKSLHEEKIPILIDAGAFILEKSNEGLARAWLAIYYDASAAIFFGADDNRAWVVFRDTTVSKTPLVATPFADRLDKCLVYFDEAHTRGVDLVLPPLTRGALTLALGQTKDHTVQAAMRLRQLGTTQSVKFYAPPEVDQSIRDICGYPSGRMDSSHVISWLLEQTCRGNEQLQPLYLSHGLDFCQRMEAQWGGGKQQQDKDVAQKKYQKKLLGVLEQPERQTLDQLYGVLEKRVSGSRAKPEPEPKSRAKAEARPDQDDKTPIIKLPALQKFAAELLVQRQEHAEVRAGQQQQQQVAGAFEEVEQEREVELQVEQVRAKQQRKVFSALEFPGVVHKEIVDFVKTGTLSGKKRGCKQVFSVIGETNIGKRYGVQETNSKLFVSNEFERTIELNLPSSTGRHRYDDFLRPVEWVIWCPARETALVVIPEEVEILLPSVRLSKHVHLLSYASPVTRAMTKFSGLNYYAVPSLPETDTASASVPEWLPIELGILAGRLYMNFDECLDMKAYLDQAVEAVAKGKAGAETKAKANAKMGQQPAPLSPPPSSVFCQDPVGFLLEWMSLRRVGQDIMHTPAAYVCQGRPLRSTHQFFAATAALAMPSGAMAIAREKSEDEDEDEGSEGGGGGAEYEYVFEEEEDGHGDGEQRGAEGAEDLLWGDEKEKEEGEDEKKSSQQSCGNSETATSSSWVDSESGGTDEKDYPETPIREGGWE